MTIVDLISYVIPVHYTLKLKTKICEINNTTAKFSSLAFTCVVGTLKDFIQNSKFKLAYKN